MDAAHLWPTRFATHAARRAPGFRYRFDHGISRQAEQVVAAQTALQIQRFRRTASVTADQNAHPLPSPVDAMDDVPQQAGDLDVGRAFALAQQTQDRLTRVGPQDGDGLKTMAACMRVERRPLLAAMREIICVINVEREARRRRRAAVEIKVDQRDAVLLGRLGVRDDLHRAIRHRLYLGQM
jgi:hypothetical protein